MDKPLSNLQILITGVGIKELQHTFLDITTGLPSHSPILEGGIEYKMNIGAATALECARAGARVHLMARSENKLTIIKRHIEREVPGSNVCSTMIDLNNLASVRRIIDIIPDDKPLAWVQSVGLGAGTVKLKDDNPYLLIENISQELIDAELSVVKNTIELMQLLLPRFRKQNESRVCIISSMSAVRSFWSGSIHMAAKGAMSRFANAAMIELGPEKIYVTDIRPGGVDTGMYDSPAVQETITEIVKRYGYDWSKKAGGLRLIPPLAVGKAIVSVLSSEAHITSLNMVARGQCPHEGS